MITVPLDRASDVHGLDRGSNSLDPERHAQWRWRGLARPVSGLAKSGTSRVNSQDETMIYYYMRYYVLMYYEM